MHLFTTSTYLLGRSLVGVCPHESQFWPAYDKRYTRGGKWKGFLFCLLLTMCRYYSLCNRAESIGRVTFSYLFVRRQSRGFMLFCCAIYIYIYRRSTWYEFAPTKSFSSPKLRVIVGMMEPLAPFIGLSVVRGEKRLLLLQWYLWYTINTCHDNTLENHNKRAKQNSPISIHTLYILEVKKARLSTRDGFERGI